MVTIGKPKENVQVIIDMTRNRLEPTIIPRVNYLFVTIVLLLAFVAVSCDNESSEKVMRDSVKLIPFGSGGQVKMIYDRRQRPQALYINGKVFMVYNGGASQIAEDKRISYPYVISYDLEKESLSDPIKLSNNGSRDHHYTPIIWADKRKFLHILYGCHKTPGTHLISNMMANIGESADDWAEGAQVRSSLSYPTVFNIYGDKKLVYFRTGEHRSSWSYLISEDQGQTWKGPENDVVDLNMGGETLAENYQPGLEEWSSYQTCLPSEDGKFLHVVFCYYDDNKKKVPEKFYNPRYKTKKNLNIKYNLYYLKINLKTSAVLNFTGDKLNTPINMETADAKCKIWDTDWRGSGVPPDIIIDGNGEPAFLHVLSDNTPEEFNYYYVRYTDGKWRQTIIAPSNHKWNSNYLKLDSSGTLHAYIIVGENKMKDDEGDMDRYGGGKIEEWRSYDKGKTWVRVQDLTPKNAEYTGWKFNNIQPIKDSYGHEIEGMLLFYGWKDNEARTAKAFLLHDVN
jgi:hypothetical protein